jgi:septum formation protein
VLASGSASRRRILQNAGIAFESVVSDVDELWTADDDPGPTVAALARRKAEAVAPGRERDYVLGCDSLFVVGGRLLGKPGTVAEVADRWRVMTGSSGVLFTGHALLHGGKVAQEVVSTTVTFSSLDLTEIDAYAESRESVDVAGGFTLEGRSSAFIDRIDGDASNVLGLSVAALRRLLATFGVSITDLWI